MSIEKMHTDAGGVAGPDGSGLVWLNSVEVVDRIVGDFTAFVIKEAGEEGFVDRLEFECRRMNGLFLGLTPTDKYSRGPWNSPDHLGASILKRLVINGETKNGVRDAFMVYADDILGFVEDAAGRNERDWRALLDAKVARLRCALLGIPEAL